MWFEYYPEIIVHYFLSNLNLVVFRTFTLRMYTWFGCTLFSDYIDVFKPSRRGHKFSEFACWLWSSWPLF